MKNIKFQRAGVKDLQTIYNFMLMQANEERKYLNDLANKDKEDLFYTKSEIKNILSSQKNYMIIAKSGNISIGCGLAKIEKASKWNKYFSQGYLGMLYVDKKHRRKGVAKALQDNRINWLKSKEIRFLVTSVLSNNTPVIKLLDKRGFKPRLIQMYKELK